MQSLTITIKAESLYCACSPELGMVSYGACEDEALNNLEDEVRGQQLRDEDHRF